MTPSPRRLSIRRTAWALSSLCALLVVAPGAEARKDADTRRATPGTQPETLVLPPAAENDISTFMQIGFAGSPILSPDGSRLYFRTETTGTSQVYRLTPEGWPLQLTFFNDAVSFTSFNDDATWFVVGVGAGGDEQYQLYLVNGLTGDTRRLTDAPKVRHTAPAWSSDSKYIYYTANDGDASSFWLYERNLETGAVRKLLEAPGSNGANDVTEDRKKLLWSGAQSSLDSNIYLLDLESGAQECLTPHEGNASYTGAVFLPGDREVLLMSRDNPEHKWRLEQLDLKTKARTPLFDDPSPWELETYSLSQDGRFLAWVTNEDGYARLHLYDREKKRALPVPDLDGMADAPQPSDAGILAFAYNSPTQAPDIWTWDFREAAGLRLAPVEPKLRQMTYSPYAGIDPTHFRAAQLVRYPSFDGTEIPAFLYLPADYDHSHPIPFIVDVHGGPEQQSRPDFNRHFQYLLLQGFGLLAPNVRGSSGYGQSYQDADNYTKRMDSVKDIGAGAQWLIDQGYAMPGKIGIKGGSYGGYMTVAAMTEFPDLFSAGIDQVGIVNFVSFLEQTAGYRRALRESEYGPLTDRPFLESISPLHKADRIRGALLVVHGMNDPRVPIGEARQILRAAAAQGTPVDSLIFADEGHGILKRPNRLVFYRKMAEFFRRYLMAS